MSSQRERSILCLGLGLLLAVPYFATQQVTIFAATLMPLSGLDRHVPFFAPAIYAYLSLYALLALPVLAVRDLQTLREAAFGFGWISIVSNVMFLFWPTQVPVLAPPVDHPLFRLVFAVDTNRNACPSLHASLALYCALVIARTQRSTGIRWGVWFWTAAIVASTWLTKRHVAIDVVAGLVLGAATYAAMFRRLPNESPVCDALRATLRARSDLSRGLEAEIRPLAEQDWRKRVREFGFFGALAVTGVALTVWAHSRLDFGASMLILQFTGMGLTMLALNAFVLLMHEGMHGALFRNPKGNRAVSVFLGATFLMSFSGYRVLHARHHNYLGDERDPDDYHNYASHPVLVWCLHFVRLLVGSLLYLFLIPVLSLKYGTRVERRRILSEYALLLVLYSILLRVVPFSHLLVAWLVPLLMTGTLIAVRGFSQHGITDATDPYLASRTMLPHPLVGFFLLHENYHLEHHLFPEIPSYHLPRLHALLWPRLPKAVCGHSYLGFLGRFLQATPRLDETPIGLVHPRDAS